MSFFGKEKVAVVLGGGGSRGLAHLGVLQVLEEESIPIHGLIGTSVGAIVGAAYALEPDASRLITRTLRYLRSERFRSDEFRRMMFGANNNAQQNFAYAILRGIRKSLSFASLIRRPSILSGDRLRETIEEFVKDCDFSETRIPFAVPAIDLRPPREVLIKSGSLRTAVVASCSLPGFFPPVEMDGMLLADVGVMGSVPVEPARELVPGALVIAVDLSNELQPVEQIERGWDSILRVENIAARKLSKLELAKADVVIHPTVGNKYWADFSELQRMVDSGRVATRAAIEDIKSRLHGWFPFMRR
ncbi:MAG: patatin-like phospholipase family protein [Planctomycetes bacterium]|nr:patatin-like phospholipase family protein [Planctomycetota bacterium]